MHLHIRFSIADMWWKQLPLAIDNPSRMWYFSNISNNKNSLVMLIAIKNLILIKVANSPCLDKENRVISI